MTFKEWFKTSIYKDDNILDINELYCIGKNLTDLDGIEEFINLERLYCGYNKIKTLEPIKNLTNLKSLSCHDNPIIPKTTVYIPFLRLELLYWDNRIPIFKGMNLREIQEEIMRRNMNLLRSANGVDISESYIKRFKDF